MSDVFIKYQINCCVFVCFFSFNPQTQIYVSWPTFAYRRNWIYIEISIFNFYNSFATCTCLWVYKISECDTREAIVKMAQPCIFAEIPRMHGKLYPHEIALSMQFFSNHFIVARSRKSLATLTLGSSKIKLLTISRLWRYCGPSNYRFNFLLY